MLLLRLLVCSNYLSSVWPSDLYFSIGQRISALHSPWSRILCRFPSVRPPLPVLPCRLILSVRPRDSIRLDCESGIIVLDFSPHYGAYTWFISCNLVSGGINLLKFSSNFLNELLSNNFPSNLFPASLSPAMARPVPRVSSVAAPEWREVVKHIPRSPCKSIFTHSMTSHHYKVPMGCDCGLNAPSCVAFRAV